MTQRKIIFYKKVDVKEGANKREVCLPDKPVACMSVDEDDKFYRVTVKPAETANFVAQVTTSADDDVVVEVGFDKNKRKTVVKSVYYPKEKYDIQKIRPLLHKIWEKYEKGCAITEFVEKSILDLEPDERELQEALSPPKKSGGETEIGAVEASRSYEMSSADELETEATYESEEGGGELGSPQLEEEARPEIMQEEQELDMDTSKQLERLERELTTGESEEVPEAVEMPERDRYQDVDRPAPRRQDTREAMRQSRKNQVEQTKKLLMAPVNLLGLIIDNTAEILDSLLGEEEEEEEFRED
jgi:hypothetical protein